MKKVISESALQARIIQLANTINQSEKHSKTPVVFVGILNGAFMFFSDLVKYIKFPIEIDFVRVKSYDGQNRKEIKFTKDLEVDIKGKHVYLVDDIIDSGHTMKFLIDHFKERGACDWRNDPNSMETPRRVAKAYVNDLWAGRYTAMSPITSFPSDGYDGIIIERNIPLTSMCSHHHQTIGGVVHIGYIAGEKGQVIGLSKLNRIVELFGRRGAIQEQLTSAIHNAVSKITEGNRGVIVTIVGTHNCVSCRGVKHQGAAMVTTKASGVFRENDNLARKEFFDSLKINNGGHNI